MNSSFHSWVYKHLKKKKKANIVAIILQLEKLKSEGKCPSHWYSTGEVQAWKQKPELDLSNFLSVK